MSNKIIKPACDFIDPRLERGFAPEHWPLCNGKATPLPSTTEAHERRCIEFLAAYYHLNLLNSRLLKLPAKSTGRKDLLSQIDRALNTLEKLEDRYAPIGFYGEPIMDDIFYRDIEFVRPALSAIFPEQASQCSHVAIPGLDEIPESELRGSVRVFRFGHEKRKTGI